MKKDKILKVLIFNLGMILGFVGCNANTSQKGFKDKLTEYSTETCLDEVIKSLDSNILDDVSKLEDYIELSNKFSKIDLPLAVVPNEVLRESKLMSVSEIEALLEKVSKINEKDSDYEDTVVLTTIQTKLLNKHILLEGYKTSADLVLLTIKSKLVDMYGLPEDVAIALVNQITIPSKIDFTNNDSYPENWDKYIRIGENDIRLPNEIRNLIMTVYRLQENIVSVSNDYSRIGYNPDRNDLISESLEEATEVLPKSYKLKIEKHK